jgi:hypothetical protein
MKKRMKVAGLLFLLSVVLLGCGGTSSTADVSPDTTYEDTYSETPAQAAVPFSANFWVKTEAKQSDGSSARAQLELGDLVAAGDFIAPEGFAGLTNTCDLDFQRDALIPGELTVENTTNGFPIAITSGIMIAKPFSPEEGFYSLGPETSVAQSFSSSQSCEPANELDMRATVDFELSDGETGRHKFLIVVHEYYSPEYPQGDIESLGYLRGGIYFPAMSSDFDQTCVSASVPVDGIFVRLDGKRIPEYAYEPSDLPRC